MSVQLPDQTYKWLLESLAAVCNTVYCEACPMETCPFEEKTDKKCTDIIEDDWHEFFETERELAGLEGGE